VTRSRKIEHEPAATAARRSEFLKRKGRNLRKTKALIDARGEEGKKLFPQRGGRGGSGDGEGRDLRRRGSARRERGHSTRLWGFFIDGVERGEVTHQGETKEKEALLDQRKSDYCLGEQSARKQKKKKRRETKRRDSLEKRGGGETTRPDIHNSLIALPGLVGTTPKKKGEPGVRPQEKRRTGEELAPTLPSTFMPKNRLRR